MRLVPDTTFGRLALLIGTLLLTILLLVGVLARLFALTPARELYGDLIAGSVLAAQHAPVQARALGVRIAAEPPASARPAQRPLELRLAEYLQSNIGPEGEVRFERAAGKRIWVREGAGGDWVGVPMPAVLAQAPGLSLAVVAISLLAIIIAASWFARSLTRPLERLARRARTLGRDEEPLPPPDPGAPRELRQLQAALRHAAEDVRRSARERELLLAGVSHDLRTPLARLRLGLELSPLPARERVQMEAEIEEMDQIIGQFLDFVRDGRDEPAQALDLRRLCEELVHAAERAGMAWQLAPGPAVPVSGRPLALRRALRNLMGNAERHGAAPRSMVLEQDGGTVRLSVLDRGPGVDDAVLPRLGQAFVRAQPARTGSVGAGLGLSLVGRVAATHGGRLELAQRQGGGFAATLVLPVTPV